MLCIFLIIQQNYMNCNESLEFGAIHFGQISGGLSNEIVKQTKKMIIGVLHSFFVVARIFHSLRRIASPNQLNAQQSNLWGKRVQKLNKIKARLRYAQVGSSEYAMHSLLWYDQKSSQPTLNFRKIY